MEAVVKFRVINAERVGGDVVIEFDCGECALYPAALLHSVLTHATEPSDAEFEEDQEGEDYLEASGRSPDRGGEDSAERGAMSRYDVDPTVPLDLWKRACSWAE